MLAARRPAASITKLVLAGASSVAGAGSSADAIPTSSQLPSKLLIRLRATCGASAKATPARAGVLFEDTP
jgi:hypothetical protein